MTQSEWSHATRGIRVSDLPGTHPWAVILGAYQSVDAVRARHFSNGGKLDADHSPSTITYGDDGENV
jgi:hypothetical protein